MKRIKLLPNAKSPAESFERSKKEHIVRWTLSRPRSQCAENVDTLELMDVDHIIRCKNCTAQIFLFNVLFLRRANTQLEARGRSEDQSGHAQHQKGYAGTERSFWRKGSRASRQARNEGTNKRSVEKMLFSDCTDRWNRDSQFRLRMDEPGRTLKTMPILEEFASTPKLENNVS